MSGQSGHIGCLKIGGPFEQLLQVTLKEDQRGLPVRHTQILASQLGYRRKLEEALFRARDRKA